MEICNKKIVVDYKKVKTIKICMVFDHTKKVYRVEVKYKFDIEKLITEKLIYDSGVFRGIFCRINFFETDAFGFPAYANEIWFCTDIKVNLI